MEFFAIIKPEYKAFVPEGAILTYDTESGRKLEVEIVRFEENKMFFVATNEDDRKYLEKELERQIEKNKEKEEDE